MTITIPHSNLSKKENETDVSAWYMCVDNKLSICFTLSIRFLACLHCQLCANELALEIKYLAILSSFLF